MEPIRVRVLGPLAIADATGRTEPVRGNRNRQVLSALALHSGRTCSDSALCDALWPHGRLPQDAPGTIRTYVARVRHLGGGLDIRREERGYRLVLDPAAIDATAFEQRATAGLAAWRTGAVDRCARELGDALGVWSGEPWMALPDWHPAVVDASRLGELHDTVAEHEAAARLVRGEVDIAARLRSLVAESPLREFRWELLMRALAMGGQHTEAVRAYQDARHHLLDEVGLEPSERLRELDAALAEGRAPPPLVPTGAPPAQASPISSGATAVRRSPLVDRRDEWAVALDALASVRDGPHVVSVDGEAGIGKSRLAEEVAEEARAAGMAVVTTQCHEAEGAGAYRAMLPTIGTIIDLAGGAPGEIDHLRILVPGLSAEPDPDALGEDRRLRVFDSVARLFGRVASTEGLLLVIDDLQWIDEDSAALLAHVLRHNPEGPILVVATHRLEDPRGQQTVTRWLADIGRTARCTALHLGELADADAVDLLGGLDLDQPGGVDDVVAVAGGNPLFLVELGRLLSERKSMDAVVSGLPPSVASIIDRRLLGAPDDVVDLLRRLALSPRGLTFAQLAGASGVPRAELIDRIESAVHRGLVVERVGADDIVYEFSHALFRLAMEDQLSLARRAALHHELALATTALVEKDAGRWTARAAYHWFEAGRSGNPACAVELNQRAAELALAGTAYEDAVTHYQRALRAQGWLDRPPAENEAAALHLGAAEACSRAGRFADRRHHAQEAYARARSAGLVEVAARAALVHGGTRSTYGAPNPETTALLAGALELLDAEDGIGARRDLHAMVTARYAQELNHAGALEDSRRLTSTALELAGPTTNDRVAASVFRERIWTLNHPDHLDERVATIQRMIGTALAAGDPELEMEARVWNAAALLEQGEPHRFEAELQRLAQLRERAPVPVLLVRVATLEATLAMTRADYERGMQLAGANLEMGLRVEPENAEQVFRAQMIAPLRDLGLLETAAEEVASVAATYAEVPSWQCAAAFVYSEIGDADRARATIDALADAGLDRIRRDLAWAQAVTYLADAVANLRMVELAGALQELLTPFSGRQASLWDIATNGAVDGYLGRLCLVRGEVERACHLLDAAVRQNEQAGAVSQWLRSRLDRHRAQERAGAQEVEPVEAIVADATAVGIAAIATEAVGPLG